MKLEQSFYKELEEAKKQKIPLIIPVGTIEYHGPHCPLGCDTQIVMGMIERLSERKDLVIAPPVWYGVASYAVAGPEKNTVQIDADVFEQYIFCILKSLILGGWRNIYLIIHHQYEQENLMPMTLACMKASKKLIMQHLEETQGYGWWGDQGNVDYYAELDASENPLNWIKVLPCMSQEAQEATGYDHAGKWECSLLSALLPGSVQKDRVRDSDEWFIQSATESSPEIGEEIIEWSLRSLEERIT
ncbi:MAG: creatininase family protein [Clostridia bacterium]|nr:creatininase family protein [Clostridia bacterium]